MQHVPRVKFIISKCKNMSTIIATLLNTDPKLSLINSYMTKIENRHMATETCPLNIIVFLPILSTTLVAAKVAIS